jgi:hypothetical protein
LSGANLLSWFSLGLLAGSSTALVVPIIGGTLAFLVALCALLAALLAHALAEDRQDRGALTRVAAAYFLASVAAWFIGLWPIALVLAAGSVATVVQVTGWEGRPAPARA